MNPMVQSAIGAVLRWAFTFLAGWFVQHGIWTHNEAEIYVGGAVIGTLTLIWGLWNKYHGRLKLLTALTMPEGSTEAQVDAKIAGSAPNPPVTTPKTQAP